MTSYDIKKDHWGIYQHNPNTTSNTPIRRSLYAQSIVIEELGKGFLISGAHEVANSTFGASNGSWQFFNEVNGSWQTYKEVTRS